MSHVTSKKLTSRPVTVDLFCGAGGLSYGMQAAGINIAAGIDVDAACKYPFEANVKAEFHEMDITKLDMSFVKSLFPQNCTKILAGCAPCQPFSSYQNGSSLKKSGTDERWRLLYKFMDAISHIRPEVVTMENVPRIQSHQVFKDFLDVLDQGDYHYNYTVVRCEEYGIPQTRRRLVLLASRLGHIRLIPSTHEKSEYVTVENTIGHMCEIEAGSQSKSDPLHRASALSDKNLKRIKKSTPGGTWRNWKPGLRAPCHTRSTGRTYSGVYGRMVWTRPGPTVTTQFHGFGNGRFGHPSQNRAISLREGALLQTFPETYEFIPDGTPVQIRPIARMIGNAVPVNMGRAIGISIMRHLQNRYD